MPIREDLLPPGDGSGKVSRVRRSIKMLGSSLPPIATFSQKITDTCHSSEPVRKGRKRFGRKHRTSRSQFYCDWSNCPRAISRIPFLHKCRLKYHMRGHLDNRDYKCSICDQKFNTPLNLKRHQVVHYGCKPYKCQVCGRHFSRSSERSRCQKHHRLVEEAKLSVEQNVKTTSSNVVSSSYIDYSSSSVVTPSPSSSATVYCSVGKVTTEESSRCKPYKCPVCPKTRAYTDPGSLRKHMRLYHPDYKKNQRNADNGTSVSKQLATVGEPVVLEPTASESLVQPMLIPVVSTEKLNSMASPDTSVITVPFYYPDQWVVGPVWLRNPTYKSASDDSNRDAGLSDLAVDCHNSVVVSLSSTEPALFVTEEQNSSAALHSMQSQTVIAHSHHDQQAQQDVQQTHFDEVQQWNGPVDLCSSTVFVPTISGKVTDYTMCTFATEKSIVPSSQVEHDPNELITFWNDPSLIDQSVALDLTETPSYVALPIANEVIDLSGDTTFAVTPVDPIDLSAPQLQRKDDIQPTSSTLPNFCVTSSVPSSTLPGVLRSNHSVTNWDPEPGFSFTDLLTNNDIDDGDTILDYLLSTDLSLHTSPCKSFVSSGTATVAESDTAGTQPPPLDLRLPHTPLFSL